jgi:hypothetical protein
MPQLTFNPTTENPTDSQKVAEAAALAQGEKLLQAQQADLEARYAQEDRENSDVGLIGGKFKSQEDLLKAYEELQKKLGKGESQEDETETPETPTEASEEQAEDVPEQEVIFNKAAAEYQDGGELSEESLEALSKMDSKELIKAYVQFFTKSAQQQQVVQLQQTQLSEIKSIAGGDDGYNQMIGWAAENLEPQEIESFNTVTNSGNYPAIRFAVEALTNRYKQAVGYEGKMLTGRKADTGIKPYRSNAELARDIADPRYQTDPAFRQDVEARLTISQDLL